MQSPTIIALGNTAGPRSFSTYSRTHTRTLNPERMQARERERARAQERERERGRARARAERRERAQRERDASGERVDRGGWVGGWGLRERERTENRSLEGLHGLLLEVLEALILHLLVQRLDVEGHLQRHKRKRQGGRQGGN